MKAKISFAILLLVLAGCSRTVQQSGSTSTVVIKQAINELEKEPVPGTVDDVWTEPMYDMVQVPGQIDQHGVYYRLPHRELVEIRPGKYQRVQFPAYDGTYPQPQR